MIKPIGSEELVFCTITGIVPQLNSVSIKFKHLSGTESDHCVSMDKQKYINCYNELEVGCTYVIVTEHVKNKRWIWTKCILVSKKEAEQFYKMVGLVPSYDDLAKAMAWLKEKRKPAKRLTLESALEF